MYHPIAKFLAGAGLLALGLTACKKDEVRATAELGNAPVLTASSTNVGVLTRANRDNVALTYSWTPYAISVSDNAGVVSPAVYTLQIAKAGTGFAAVQEVAAGSAAAASLAIKVGELNAKLLALNFPFGQPARVDVRLKTFVAGNLDLLYSAPTTLTATPYDECVPPTADTWGLVGPAGDGWPDAANVTDRTMPYNCTEGAYVLRMPLNAGPFKFRANRDWGTNLGGVTGNYASGVSLTLSGPDLVVATAGTYTVKLFVTLDPATGKAASGRVVLTQ